MAFALFAYFDLRYVERRIDEGAVVSSFREAVLDMRRHEKNYLLYHDAAELDAALALSAEASGLLGQRDAFATLAPPERLGSLAAGFAAYTGLMRRYRAVVAPASPQAVDLAHRLREAGHALSEEAETLARRERQVLAATVQQSQWALFASIGVVAALGLLIGHLLSRAVVRPLRRLEDELKPIAQGRFTAFHQVSRDREIVSLTGALNRMLDELEARRRQVLQSEKLASLGVLASGVAHELNNPLGNISASCQILLEELDSADRREQREWLAQIDSETERARRIVRTLLDYSRRRAFHVERLALEELLEKCLTLLRRELPSRDAVRLDLPADLAVCGDEQQLQQVFINLIKNAVDAGGPEVRIELRAGRHTWQESQAPRGAHLVGDPRLIAQDDIPLVVISLTDNGPGIDPERLSQVFDPFFTTREPGKGVGLGLYIVEEIVREHGGCIAVENPVAGGCRFTIWLPCRAEESARD